MSNRLLIPAITAVTVVGIVVGAGVVASRDDDDPRPAASASRPALGSPTLPALSIGGGRDVAVGAPEAAAGKIAAPQGGDAQVVTIKGELPTATDTPVTAYRLVRRTPAAAEIKKLATALGLTGEPISVAGSWQLADGDRYLTVDPTPTLDWRLTPGGIACASSGAGSAVTGGSVGSEGGAPPTAAVAPSKGMAAASSMAPDLPIPAPSEDLAAVSSVGPDTPVTNGGADPAAGGPATTPIPGPCAGGTVSSDVACAPDGAQTLVACPTQSAAPMASDEVARSAAVALLAKLGLAPQTFNADGLRLDPGYGGVRTVYVPRMLDGRQVEGLSWSVGVDAKGTVVSASGQLAEPEPAGAYPMLPPAELAQTLVNSRMRVMLCEQKPGVEGCAPPPPLVVTGASIGLSLVFPTDFATGEAYLLPSWLFTIEGDSAPTAVVAVPDRYRSAEELPTGKDTGTIEPFPMPPQSVPAVPPADEPREGSAAPAEPNVTLPPTLTAPVPPDEPGQGSAEPATGRATGPAPDPGPKLTLATSSWKPGDPALQALITGTLLVDQRGCLRLAPATEGPLATLLWPEGSYGRHQGKEVVVLSSKGEIVAKTGEQFSAGGGAAPDSSTAATPCGHETFSIMDAGPYND